ncbi:uncharacterized protein LOC135494899 [Lineus longissimus]|uniref:uncharacterized protein LOC135494899 n=1 Tax=Lineus longissimus TaxID=88925 RepID=UPI00315CF500
MPGDLIERLIFEIEKHPMIYDKSLAEFKDTERKERVWKQIGDKANLTVGLAKTKWKSVRDAIRKYLDAIPIPKSGQGRTKPKKEYKYAKMLEFLRPHMENRKSSGNLEDLDTDTIEAGDDIPIDNINVEDELELGDGTSSEYNDKQPETFAAPKPRCQQKKKASKPASEVDDAIVSYIKSKNEKKPKQPDEDENISDFMKSMIASIKKFPPQIRSSIMFKIHGLVHEAEMHVIYGSSGNQASQHIQGNPSTSTGFSNVGSCMGMGQMQQQSSNSTNWNAPNLM